LYQKILHHNIWFFLFDPNLNTAYSYVFDRYCKMDIVDLNVDVTKFRDFNINNDKTASEIYKEVLDSFYEK
jgi:hypothetical protein